MKQTPAWRRYLRFWGRDPDADLDDELRFHLESRVEDYVAQGMNPQQARDEATRRFGDVARVRQLCTTIDHDWERSMRRSEWMDAMRQDVRYAARSLRKSPAFALVAVLTLALGIGANSAIFSVVDGVLLRPPPFGDPSRVVQLFTQFPGLGFPRSTAFSEPEFVDVRGNRHAFAEVAAYSTRSFGITGGGEPERVRVMRATASMFPVLGVQAARGRVYAAEEDRPGRSDVLVLTDALWRRRFGADPSIVGRAVSLNGVPRTVVGVLPPGVRLGDEEAYMPLALNPDSLAPRGGHFLTVMARLAPGATVQSGAAELRALGARLRALYPTNYPPPLGFGFTLLPLREAETGELRAPLLVLLGAVGLVLLIACANVANMLLARGAAREREIAVRTALGAGRGRIVRQLLTESVLLAALGGAAGLALARWGVRTLLAVSPGSVPHAERVTVDLAVVAATLALAVLTSLLFGLAPALRVTRLDLNATLKDAARGSSSGAARSPLRRALVVAEMALAVVVVAGAGLLIKSFWRMHAVDPGFRAERVLTFDVVLPRERYADSARPVAFYDQLLDRLRALPGVAGAGAVTDLPLGGTGGNWDVEVEGRPVGPNETAPSPNFQVVAPDYFRAMGIAVRGREIARGDDERAPLVAVVNETMARTLWPGREVLGKRFRVLGDSMPRWMTVVGVARDVRQRQLSVPARPEYFMPMAQFPRITGDAQRGLTVVMRATVDPASLAPAARRAVRALDPALPVANVRTMDEVVASSVSRPRFTMLLLGAFAALALALASVGIYGVMSYAVAQRRQEMGIRVALGASAGDVLRLVVGQGMRLAGLGVLIGVAGALALTRLLASLLFEVSATDPATFVAIPVVLGAVAAAASWLPARRAARVDPAVALRAE